MSIDPIFILRRNYVTNEILICTNGTFLLPSNNYKIF